MSKINVDDLTFGQIKEIQNLNLTDGVQSTQTTSCLKPLVNKGDKIFTRTLTFHYVGEVVEDNHDHIVLNNCSWVADSGQFTSAIKDGSLSEVEVIGNGVKILKSNITDCIPWVHDLPRERI